MSNLLKRASIINKDERVIDYNRIIQEKLDALKKAAPKDSDGFIEGLHSPQVEQMVDEDGNPVDMSICGEDTAAATQEAEAQEVPDLDEVRHRLMQFLRMPGIRQTEYLKTQGVRQNRYVRMHMMTDLMPGLQKHRISMNRIRSCSSQIMTAGRQHLRKNITSLRLRWSRNLSM